MSENTTDNTAQNMEGAPPQMPLAVNLQYTKDLQELVEPILLVEVPRLIFPYVRSIISDVTRDGGFPPVVLQPIDFVALWQAKRAQQFPEPAGEA
nr:protein-export chaperone SecB [Gluconobacter sp. P5E10]